jgi:hypothetical protein
MAVRKWAMAALLAVSTVAGSPMAAQAHGGDHGWHRGHDDDDDDGYRGRRHHRYREPYYEAAPVYYQRGYAEPRYDDRGAAPRPRCRTSGTTGLIIGGAAGALLGRELDRHGDRTPGTIIGAGAGALVGREIARKNRC